MSSFFPLGVPQSGSYAVNAVSAISASFPAVVGMSVTSASYARTIIASGAAGLTGPTPQNCVGTVSGSQGAQGPSGSQGPSLTTCPTGSVACPNLTPPSGYAIVCIQIPAGCTSDNTVCPGSLP